MKPRSEAQSHYVTGYQPGSVMASMDISTQRAFRAWLKGVDNERHILERQLRGNGASVGQRDRFHQA